MRFSALKYTLPSLKDSFPSSKKLFTFSKSVSAFSRFFCLLLSSFLVSLVIVSSLVAATSVTNNTNLSIPDNSNAVTSTISFTEVRTITDLNVTLDISHTYISDLTVSLQSPDGTNVVLHKRSGGSADNISATYDVAATPYESLTIFNGMESNGTWTLSLQDSAAGDVGSLSSWTLTIEGYENTNYSSVIGTVTYEDRPLSSSGYGTSINRPVAYAQVDLINSSDSTILGSAITASDGTYNLRIVKQSLVNSYLRVYGRVVSSKLTGQVFNNSNSNSIYALVSSTSSRNTNTNFELSVHAPYSNGSGLGGVFNILEQVVEVQLKMFELGESKPPLVTVYWQSGSTDGTYFRESEMALHLYGMTSDPDEYDDSVICHELGHYIAAVYSVDTSLGGSHSSSDSHQDYSLAWSEGWANYFSSYIRDYHLYFDYTTGGVTTIDLELPSHSSTATGQDNESAVHSMLWDIYDGASTNDTTLSVDDDSFDCSCGGTSLWDVVSNEMGNTFTSDCVIFESFYGGWISRYGDTFQRTELDEVLALRGVNLNRYHLYEDLTDHTIADNSTININFTISDDVTITSIAPFLHIEHSYPNDLIISLYHPDGTGVTLHNRTSATSSGRLTAWYETYETTPAGSFSVLNNKSSAGQWQLRIIDNAAGNTGSLKVFKLEIEGTPRSEDLTVSSVTSSSSAVAGGNVSVTGTIRNRSSVDVGVSFYESYYLSSDRTITETDVFLGSFLNAPLAASTSRENNQTITLPTSISSGNYFLGMIVDFNGTSSVVDELIEDNNTGVTSLAVAITGAAAGTDLQPSNLQTSATATSGTTIEATLTVSNAGSIISAGFTNSWYLSPDTFINGTDDIFIDSFAWTTLDPLTSLSVARIMTIPSSTSTGTWYLGVITDSGSTVSETDEGNNIIISDSGIAIEQPVPGVDIRAVSVSGASSIAQGSPLSLVSVVRNGGTSTVTSFIDGYFLSSDSMITTSDTYLQSFAGGTLNSGVQQTFSRQITIPESTTLGDYYLGMLLETLDDVDETNNYASMAIEVISPDLPDLVAVNFIAPQSLTPGSVANFTHSISNSGPNDSGDPGFYLDYYLSTDQTITTTDTFLTRVHNDEINANSGGTYTVSTSIPPTAPPAAEVADLKPAR